MYQLPREFGNFKGLAGLCFFSVLCAFGCSNNNIIG